MSLLLAKLAQISSRPRYAFMVLSLIAEIAGKNGRAGPHVVQGNASMLLRDWLTDALTPMGGRDPKRLKLAERVRHELEEQGRLPGNAEEARTTIDDEVRDRVRASGKTNLSRAVTELVKAGLLKRHYEGYRVDHLNRGAQRHAVYTLQGQARCLVPGGPLKGSASGRQGELPLH
ncbi:MAG: hypothetical protein EOP13_01135 [Pseudomonas sp.]|uniref:hypothetical protein n=1 Tax=Pseudomonas sp. TaxID=306 RepID=UPI0012259F69|nr:hypothetical protein [Pseudomonas sp.]RZI76700.1 MAG: hypothetical protein EOP13_01135 [Pseudomonas sp.]